MTADGFGNWVVRSLNGIGLIGILGAAIVIGVEWASLSRLRIDLAAHCLKQVEREERQNQLDLQQDKVVQMYNEALIEIRTNTENMKDDIAEVKRLLLK